MVLLIGCTLGSYDLSRRAEPLPLPRDTGAPTVDTDLPTELPVADPPAVCINELMADNVNAVMGEDGTPADWVELHNPTDTRVALDGWTLGDDEPTALDGLSLDPGGYLLLWADDKDAVGHLDGALDADGGHLTLTTPEGGAATLTWGALEADWSAARTTPCGSGWTWSWRGTPGADNGGADAVVWLTTGDAWSYLDSGVAPDASWTTLAYDDSAWPSGPSPLGYGDTTTATTLSYGADPNNKQVTTWLRRRFTGATGAIAVTLTAQIDDGAIIWLNGAEVARFNLPATGVDATTLASASTPAEAAWWRFDLDPDALLDGENLLAVELHQASVSSSDLAWDATLTAEVP